MKTQYSFKSMFFERILRIFGTSARMMLMTVFIDELVGLAKSYEDRIVTFCALKAGT